MITFLELQSNYIFSTLKNLFKKKVEYLAQK